MFWITFYTFSLSKKNFNFEVLLQGGIIVYCIQSYGRLHLGVSSLHKHHGKFGCKRDEQNCLSSIMDDSVANFEDLIAI